jgi:hypothetical protein
LFFQKNTKRQQANKEEEMDATDSDRRKSQRLAKETAKISLLKLTPMRKKRSDSGKPRPNYKRNETNKSKSRSTSSKKPGVGVSATNCTLKKVWIEISPMDANQTNRIRYFSLNPRSMDSSCESSECTSRSSTPSPALTPSFSARDEMISGMYFSL